MARPDFQTMTRNYPTDDDPEVVKAAIGGEADAAWITNTCVMRVSRALNACGAAFEIPRRPPGLLTVDGADGKHYALRVQEFLTFMRARYGAPDVSVGGKAITDQPFLNEPGIIAFHVSGWSDATGHFTLWDGQTPLYQGDHDYFAMPKSDPGQGPWLTGVDLWRFD